MILLIALAAVGAIATTPVCDAVWHDVARDRDVPVRIRLPPGIARVPLVEWSPGLGGEVSSGGVWTRTWTAAGVAVVAMQYKGSDGAVYRGAATPDERRARMIAAAAPDQLLARVGDARFVLSEMTRRQREGACDLNRIDPDRTAIAGHSMGAWVAQGLAGQRINGEPVLRDLRFRVALALSPTASPGTDAFARVTIPFLSVTGTRDGVSENATPGQVAAALALRRAAWQSMPADGGKCLLVLGSAEHMMLAGNRPATDALARHVETAGKVASTAFLMAALTGKPTLQTGSLRDVLNNDDVLTCK